MLYRAAESPAVTGSDDFTDTASVYHVPSAVSVTSSLPVTAGLSAARYSTVASIARVIASSGENAVDEVPPIRPFSVT